MFWQCLPCCLRPHTDCFTLSHRTIERDQLASRLEDEGAVRQELEAQVESMTQQLETMANEIEDNDTKVSPWCK